MKVTMYKCDGCSAKLSAEDKSRERCYKLTTPFHEAEIDLCRSCWKEMCAAIGKTWGTKDHRLAARETDADCVLASLPPYTDIVTAIMHMENAYSLALKCGLATSDPVMVAITGWLKRHGSRTI